MSGKGQRRLSRRDRAGMVVHGFWPDRNPLRRPCDRAEAALIGMLLVLFLLGAPLSALFAARWAHSAAGAQSSRYRVQAVLLADASYNAYAWSDTVVKARWTAPDGTHHTGNIQAAVGTHRGAKVTIWTNRSGQALGPPLTQYQIDSQAVLAAVVAPLTLAFVVISLGLLGHQLLERRRLAAWDAEWRTTGPQWTRLR